MKISRDRVVHIYNFVQCIAPRRAKLPGTVRREKREAGHMQVSIGKSGDKSCAELMLCHRELKELIDALSAFERKIAQYKKNNEGKTKLGVTHLHFRDCGQTGKESKDDVAFYVDLDW